MGLYVISMDIELGPKRHHIFVDGGGLTQLGFTHMRACCPSPHRTELGVGVLAGLGLIFILFFFIFQNNVFVHQFLFKTVCLFTMNGCTCSEQSWIFLLISHPSAFKSVVSLLFLSINVYSKKEKHNSGSLDTQIAMFLLCVGDHCILYGRCQRHL